MVYFLVKSIKNDFLIDLIDVLIKQI